MNTDIAIRNDIKPGDIGSIIRLHGEYYYRNNGFDYTFEPYVAIPLAEFVLRKNDNERIWIVEKKNIIKGCIAVSCLDKTTAQLRWFLLDESVQGIGIGRKLIEAGIQFAKEKRYKRMILWTVDKLTKAIDVYIKNGFKIIEEKKHNLWGKVLNEQCYELELSKKNLTTASTL